MRSRKRKTIRVMATLSVAPHVSAAEARRELRTRVNEGCCWFYDEEDVRVRQAKPAGRVAGQARTRT